MSGKVVCPGEGRVAGGGRTLDIDGGEGAVGLLHEVVDGATLDAAAGVRLAGVDRHHANRVHELLFQPGVTAHRRHRHHHKQQ